MVKDSLVNSLNWQGCFLGKSIKLLQTKLILYWMESAFIRKFSSQ
jgi:hypothetical protein